MGLDFGLLPALTWVPGPILKSRRDLSRLELSIRGKQMGPAGGGFVSERDKSHLLKTRRGAIRKCRGFRLFRRP
jgi:hypothetical protein